MYSTDDVGKGAMANIDDGYAAKNPGALALAFTTSHANAYAADGTELNSRPTSTSRYMINSFVYWDGELDRELLDDNILASYNAETGGTPRFYFSNSGSMPIGTNNSTKYNMCLTADISGDWREEIISRCSETGEDTLRVYVSTLETDYKLTTLMHDSQYRSGVATENVGYNQPPHTSYYIGSAALAEGKNYLAPAYAYTDMTTPRVLSAEPVETPEPIVEAKKIVADNIATANVNEDAVGYYVENMQISDAAEEYKWVVTMSDNARFVKKTSLPTLSGEGSVSFGMIIYGILESGDIEYTTDDIYMVTVE